MKIAYVKSTCKKGYFPRNYLLLVALFFVVFCHSLYASNENPETGIYDGTIGSDQIILIAESMNNNLLKGNFVISRGKAVEESHSI